MTSRIYSMKDVCDVIGVAYPTLASWRRRYDFLARSAADQTDSRYSFDEVMAFAIIGLLSKARVPVGSGAVVARNALPFFQIDQQILSMGGVIHAPYLIYAFRPFSMVSAEAVHDISSFITIKRPGFGVINRDALRSSVATALTGPRS